MLQRFFTFVVPLAFVSYFPALYLLDRPELQGLPSWLPGATPLAAALLALTAWLGLAGWRAALPEYR